MLLVAAKIVEEDGKAVLRVQVSRDGSGGMSSAICPVVNKSGLRAVLSAMQEDILKFLAEDLQLEYTDG